MTTDLALVSIFARMKSVAAASLMLIMVCDSNAQDSLDRMRMTEVHLGAGFQQLIHVGGRFRVDPFIMLEVGIGSYPFGEHPFNFPDNSPPISFSVGFTAVPRPAQRNPGFILTILYSAWHKDDLQPLVGSDYWSGFIHFVTGNIGWLTQHSSGFSFLARLGGGLAVNDYDFQMHGGGIGHDDYVQFWPNLEIALGYAF